MASKMARGQKKGQLQEMPTRFKCAKGGEWKRTAEFSQAQQDRWRKAKEADTANIITPESIGLVCKIHAQPAQRERRCRGPCDRILTLKAFSKFQRNRPDAWCIVCTNARNFEQAPPKVAGADAQGDGQTAGSGYDSASDSATSSESDDESDTNYDDGSAWLGNPDDQDKLHGSERDSEEEEGLVSRRPMGQPSGPPSSYRTALESYPESQTPSVMSNAAHVAPHLRLPANVPSISSRYRMTSEATSETQSQPPSRVIGGWPPRATGRVPASETTEATRTSQAPDKKTTSKWYKGDTRRVFQAHPAEATVPTGPVATQATDWDSDEDY
ncbi:hypothetical protein GGR56DRAFT_369371 [Xylariaceae sp. FL0804]|nr:hypothetical protein GGR56DRAFT_369371 [Xylariaceae sp. FL0804]